MARINLSIPDELRERMNPVDRFVNWSIVAQKAFERQVDLLTTERSPEMNAVIERIRASKEKQVDSVIANGFAAGKRWAEQEAEYLQIKCVEEFDWSSIEAPHLLQYHLERLIGVNDSGEFWHSAKINLFESDPNQFYVEGFINGIKSVWTEIASNL